MFPDEPVLDAAAVVDEVRSAFEAYERALIANDVAAMDAAFWNDARVVRFGIAEIQHGYAESVSSNWRTVQRCEASSASRSRSGGVRTSRRSAVGGRIGRR